MAASESFSSDIIMTTPRQQNSAYRPGEIYRSPVSINSPNGQIVSYPRTEESLQDCLSGSITEGIRKETSYQHMQTPSPIFAAQSTPRKPSEIKCNVDLSSLPYRYTDLDISIDICRICHQGAETEKLIAPCRCNGYAKFVHRSCELQWLRASKRNTCEICQLEFKRSRKGGELRKWLNVVYSCPNDRRNMISDTLCFLLLTPLVLSASGLCIRGTVHYLVRVHHSSWQAFGLCLLAVVLMSVYVGWCIAAFRFHLRNYRSWASTDVTFEANLSENFLKQRPTDARKNASTNNQRSKDSLPPPKLVLLCFNPAKKQTTQSDDNSSTSDDNSVAMDQLIRSNGDENSQLTERV